MKVTLIKGMISPEQQESFWYDGQVATVEHNGRTLSIEATGVIRIYIDKSMCSEFEEQPRLDNADAVDKAWELGLKDEHLHDDTMIYWGNNNWFAIRELDENGDVATNDEEICHLYEDAIELAKELLNG